MIYECKYDVTGPRPWSPTSFPGFSLFPQERTLVAAGHVITCDNKLRVRLICYFSVGCLWHSRGKNPVRLYPKLQSQPIGLRKIFIDYFFFQVDQWDCTKPLSIFDRLASSEERFRTFHCTNKLQSQPIGLPKIFIDYLFFQADQSDCTKSVSIFNRFASSEERWNQNVPCQICRAWVFPLVV